MKRFAALALVFSATATAGTLNPSPYETREEAIEPVEEVAINGPFKVLIFGNSTESTVRLTGPEELLEDAEVVVADGTLTIQFRDNARWSWNPGSGMNVVVHLPALDTVGVTGAAQVDVIGVKAETFKAGTNGAGSITVSDLEADQVQLGTAGSGSIEAKGTANAAMFGIGGTGSIEAKRLRVKTAQIGVGGPGKVYADVSESAEIGVGGAGRVEVVGGAQCTFNEEQAAKIECR